MHLKLRLAGFFVVLASLHCGNGNENSLLSVVSSVSPPNNETMSTNTTESHNTTAMPTTVKNALPPKNAAEEEHKSSMAIFFILFIIVLSILLIHVLLVTKLHQIPESLAVVLLGMVIGALLKLTGQDWTNEESFKPNMFFLVLLPPIIFESGYNLHKGNFFANIGSILVFAIFGTLVSAIVIGAAIFLLGEADLIYRLSGVESFAFGSMISAVDPVATLAIFQALDVDPILYMLVFGESVLNDAVAIVLTTTITELQGPAMATLSTGEALLMCLGRFCAMFFGSAGLGALAGLASAVLLKHIDLRRTPSLEFAIMLVFAYLPYGLAEGLHLSGIMAILFCGVVMSHYTHFNLSPLSQLSMQLTLRTVAFTAETCVFAYLGMAFFTYKLDFQPGFAIWSIVMCLVSRAANIFPFAFLLNFFRDHKITWKMQFIMWFSGLRGAIAFALSMHTEFGSEERRRIIITTTLVLVVFTIVVLGGCTMPMMKIVSKMTDQRTQRERTKRRRRRKLKGSGSDVNMSKTREMGAAFDTFSYATDYTSGNESTTEGGGSSSTHVPMLNGSAAPSTGGRNGGTPPSSKYPPVDHSLLARFRGFEKLDEQFLRPFFVRKFTAEEKREGTVRLTEMAIKWLEEVESEASDTAPPQRGNHSKPSNRSPRSDAGRMPKPDREPLLVAIHDDETEL